MSDNILISIILLFYNDELYLDKMLNSTDKGIDKINSALSESKFIDLKCRIIKKENDGVIYQVYKIR